MTVYLCRDEFTDILCGVYDAWVSKKGHANVRLEIEQFYAYQMFHEYCRVEATEKKFRSVSEAVKAKISTAVYEVVYQASLSFQPSKADDIYRYLIYGFHYGQTVIHMLQRPEVHRVFQLSRAVRHEACQYTGFVRFSEASEGALIAMIEPKNDITAMIAPHFADRLSGEDWLIFDKQRKKAVIHPKQQPWFVMGMDEDQWEGLHSRSDEREYQQLWRIFFKSISIKERENRACQRSHLPLRYREHMLEFDAAENELPVSFPAFQNPGFMI